MALKDYAKQYLSGNPAASFTTSPIGGAIAATEVTGNTVNEVFFRMSSEPAGGSVRTQRQKHFIKNTHPTEDLTEAKIFLANSLDDWGAFTDNVSVVSTNEDDMDIKTRFIGEDSDGNPIQIESNVNGLTSVPSVSQLTDLHSVESRDQATSILQPSRGALRIYRGATLLGEQPQGKWSASSEFKFWLPASLNDSGTATDASTDPAGVSWSKVRTIETALSVAGGTLGAGDAQGLWTLWTLQAGTRPRYDLQIVMGVYGTEFDA